MQEMEMDPERLALKAVLMSALAVLEDPNSNTNTKNIKRKLEHDLTALK